MTTRQSLLKILLPAILPALLLGCGSHTKTFVSDCNDDDSPVYKKVPFTELVNHLKKYDKQYVEVTGKYIEAPEQSALFNDSLFADHSVKQAIWIDFNPDCPLYLKGTRIGLFQYNNGQFTQINNKHVTIKGRVDAHDTGHLNQYNGAIERISYIDL
jgi:glucose-6-phosphate 1-dehydrogenase